MADDGTQSSRTRARFSYMSEDLDPNLITKMLEQLPTKCYKKGDSHGYTPFYRRRRAWMLESILPDSEPIENKLRQLMDIVERKRTGLSAGGNSLMW